MLILLTKIPITASAATSTSHPLPIKPVIRWWWAMVALVLCIETRKDSTHVRSRIRGRRLMYWVRRDSLTLVSAIRGKVHIRLTSSPNASNTLMTISNAYWTSYQHQHIISHYQSLFQAMTIQAALSYDIDVPKVSL